MSQSKTPDDPSSHDFLRDGNVPNSAKGQTFLFPKGDNPGSQKALLPNSERNSSALVLCETPTSSRNDFPLLGVALEESNNPSEQSGLTSED